MNEVFLWNFDFD